MADFTIKRGKQIWRHGRVYKTGNELRLEEDGFPREEKRKHARRGNIEWHQAEATPAAEALADKEGVDLSAVEPTGADGKIIKKDVRNYIREHSQ